MFSLLTQRSKLSCLLLEGGHSLSPLGFFLFLLQCALPSSSYGMSGGEPYSRDAQAPYVVRVNGCKGALIADGVIITAAHCVHRLSSVEFITSKGEKKAIMELTETPLLYLKVKEDAVRGKLDLQDATLDMALVFFDHMHPALKEFHLKAIALAEEPVSSFDELWLYTEAHFQKEELGWVGRRGAVQKSRLLRKKARHERIWSQRFWARRVARFVCQLGSTCVEPVNFDSTDAYCSGDSGSPLVGYKKDEPHRPYYLGSLHGRAFNKNLYGAMEEHYARDMVRDIALISPDYSEELRRALGKHPDLCTKVKVTTPLKPHRSWVLRSIQEFNKSYAEHGNDLFHEQAPEKYVKMEPTVFVHLIVFDVMNGRVFIKHRREGKWIGYRVRPTYQEIMESALCKEGVQDEALPPAYDRLPLMELYDLHRRDKNSYIFFTGSEESGPKEAFFYTNDIGKALCSPKIK